MSQKVEKQFTMARSAFEYFIACRPHTFTASIIPVMVTTAVVGKSFQSSEFLRTIAMGISIQSAANLSNTYFDFVNGVDTKAMIAGDKGLVEARHISSFGVLVLSTIFYLVGLMTVLPVFLEREDNLLPIIFFSGVALAFFYTATPIGLKYKALGDITIYLCFGPLLMQGSSIMLTGAINSSLWIYSIPIGLLTEGILHANNARDTKFDSDAGAITLAIILGVYNSYLFYVFLVVSSYSACVLISLFYNWGCIAAFLTAPLAINVVNDFKVGKLHNTPDDTAMFHLPFGALMTLGIIYTKSGFLN
jgi:1,4-dihydroxy-2-naphthoate octaprenyltransferase|mmetsp:Transcript_26316/g.25155  ORF Transcript_26316/g.25155 Transcript_26316/m.25155 type:complete len:305 (-) Transcript_26316:253-1167(-)